MLQIKCWGQMKIWYYIVVIVTPSALILCDYLFILTFFYLLPLALILHPAPWFWIPLNLSVYSFCSLEFSAFLILLLGLPAIHSFFLELPWNKENCLSCHRIRLQSGWKVAHCHIRNIITIVKCLRLWIREPWIWIRTSPLIRVTLARTFLSLICSSII